MTSTLEDVVLHRRVCQLFHAVHRKVLIRFAKSCFRDANLSVFLAAAERIVLLGCDPFPDGNVEDSADFTQSNLDGGIGVSVLLAESDPGDCLS